MSACPPRSTNEQRELRQPLITNAHCGALVQISAASEKRRSRRYLIERKGLRSRQPARCIFEAHVREIELTFSNAMHQFDAGDRSGCIAKAFEAEHCIDPGRDVAMVLLDQVVQILRRSQSRLLRQRLVSLHFAHCAVGRRVTVQCDGFRSEPLTPDRPRKEGLRRSNIGPGAEPEVDRLSRSINGTVKIDPLATDLHIRLVDSPGTTTGPRKPIPPLYELRREASDPAHDCRMRQRQTALGHHFNRVSKAEFVTPVPTYTQDNDFAVEVRAMEQPVDVSQRTHCGLVLLKSPRVSRPFRCAPERKKRACTPARHA